MDKQWSHTYPGSFRLIQEQWIQAPSYSKYSITKPVSYTVNEALQAALVEDRVNYFSFPDPFQS